MTISPTQSDLLNFSRWFAAWLVVAEHTRSLLLVDFGTLPSAGVLARGFYFLTGFGHEAVMVFFVVSGYLVGGKLWERAKSGEFQWRRYFCDRLSRLYAVLIVALVLGGVLDHIAWKSFDSFGLYQGNPEVPVAVVVRDYSQGFGFVEFFGNLGFLQTILVVPFGSNGPLWSLANEWWYYVLFPLVAYGLIGLGGARWLCIGAALVLGWLLPGEMLVLFGVWLLGAGCSCFRKALLPGWLTAGLLLSSLVVARLEFVSVPYLDKFLIGGGFVLMLNSLAESTWRFPLRRVSTVLADFSYTTYLIHFPLICFMLSVSHKYWGFGLKEEYGVASVGALVAMMILVLLVSWGISLFTEAKTPALRRWMCRLAGVDGVNRQDGKVAKSGT